MDSMLHEAPAFRKAPAQFDRRFIQRTANERLGMPAISRIVWKQAFTENKIWVQRGVNFRKRRNAEARDAYCQMAILEFEGINARQQWANWRTVPGNLRKLEILRPVFALDLCCGTGHSTEVLACYLPEGSRLLGLEFNPAFVQQARAGKYLYRSGQPALVRFHAQSVLETFCDENGTPLRAGSVDLVNSCGAVGNHFDGKATGRLAEEVARVLRPGGVALIDTGFAGTPAFQVTRIFKEHGFKRLHSSKSCFLDKYRQVCLMKQG